MFQFLRGIVWEMTRPTVLGGGDPAIGPKILIRFAIMAKSVPKQLVTRLKTLVTRFFWHRLSRLSKFYFPAGGKWRVPGRPGSQIWIAGKFFYALAP
jgi:hypothetical protein